MLLLDRFLCADGSALDLATGVPVRVRVYARATTTPIFATRAGWRLVDAGARSPRAFVEAWARAAEAPWPHGVALDHVRAALVDARDGCPRAIDVAADHAAQWRRATLEIAREARLNGFVPVDVGVLGELLRGNRWHWPRWLADRSLVVLTCDGRVPAAGAVALLRLAIRDGRPHVVIRGATRGLAFPVRLAPVATLVHEGHGWGSDLTPSAEALAERAWQRARNAGEPEAAAALARWAVMLAPSPEVERCGRAALAVVLSAQGRVLEARASLPEEAEMTGADATVEQRVREARQQVEDAEQPRRPERALTDDFLHVLEACQAIEDETAVMARVLALLRERVAASAVACVVIEREETRVAAHLGSVPVDPAAARRAALTGAPLPPAAARTLVEAAWPVRYGGGIVGALWCRWSTGLTVRPADADALMRVAATALAPALHATGAREEARSEASAVHELVGESEAMNRLRAAVLRAARSPFNVLIEGESGSGKELVARAIHRTSTRRDRRFSALNCAALGEDLAEAELFGHARGAFTGAVAERAGLFEESSGGTLFLDEVSELSSRVQAKLLRVLQEHEVRRLGESHVRPIDTRVVAATNKPLADEVHAGRFRRDLRYRLDVLRLTIPPLRERLEDLPALVRHIWMDLSRKANSRAVLSPAAMAALGRYDWPGNVRELQNVLASLIVSSAPRGLVSAAHLPLHVGRSAAFEESRSLAAARREFELRFVKAALARADGRPAVAARDLGVSRQGLAKVLTRLGLRSAAPEGSDTRRAQGRA